MRLRILLVGFLLVALGSLWAANQYGVADSRQVTFYQQVKVGGTLLPPGEYKVLHSMEGENHMMFFRQLESAKGKHATAIVKCTLKPLPGPAADTQLGYKNEGGVAVLVRMQFKGDTAQHLF